MQSKTLSLVLSFLSLIFLATLCLVILTGCDSASSDSADSVVINANILTLDANDSAATAIAVKNGRFIYVGNDSGVQLFIDEQTHVFDAEKKTLLPGFNDAHMHPMMVEASAVYLGQDKFPTTDAFIKRLQEHAATIPAGDWVLGWGYDDVKLGQHPARRDLDQVSKQHPILIQHVSGHVATANSVAYLAAGITAATDNPDGGSFLREPSGEPSGVCQERAACDLLYSERYPRPPRSLRGSIDGLKAQLERFYSLGITSVADAFVTPGLMLVYELAAKEDQSMRVNLIISDEHFSFAKTVKFFESIGLRSLLGSDVIRTGTIKVFHGNSFSGHTTWLHEPYANRPDYYGLPPERNQHELNEHIADIHDAGFQLAIHTNGDREIDMVLDAIEFALTNTPRLNHRHRLEHASIVNENILKRAKKLGVVLVLHSYIYENGDKMEAFGEHRYAMMHTNKSALEHGIPVAGNSDFPVSSANPMTRIRSLVTRQSMSGKVYGKEQIITPLQALKTYTQGGAFSSFEESSKGSIETGKYADYILMSNNPLLVPSDTLEETKILLTVIGGKIVYEVE